MSSSHQHIVMKSSHDIFTHILDVPVVFGSVHFSLFFSSFYYCTMTQHCMAVCIRNAIVPRVQLPYSLLVLLVIFDWCVVCASAICVFASLRIHCPHIFEMKIYWLDIYGFISARRYVVCVFARASIEMVSRIDTKCTSTWQRSNRQTQAT